MRMRPKRHANGTALETHLESINKRRRQIQSAADAEWPHTNEANTATRRAFQLPANRPCNG